MELQILPKGIKLESQQEEYLIEKLGRDLERYLKRFPDIEQATVRVRHGTRWGFWVSYSIILPKKHHIFVEKKDADFWNAVVATKRHAEREIRKYKERITSYQER